MTMNYNPDFDVDSVLEILGTVSDNYPPGSQEDEALRVAAVALLYVRDIQKLEDYRRFFQDFYTPAIDAVTVSRTFTTRQDADEWLASGAAHDGELVRIAGQGFRVIPERKGPGWRFLRTPLPEEMKITE
jgi:hypothetical protein